MNILLLGDIHGNYDLMHHRIAEIQRHYQLTFDRIIQVGDFGYFPQHLGAEKTIACANGLIRGRTYNVPDQQFAPEMWFIRGNHEDHSVLPQGPGLHDTPYAPWKYIQDGHLDDQGILYIGGAWSIDGAFRRRMESFYPGTPFLDQWLPHLEQVSERRYEEILDTYHPDQVEYLITHDCDWELLRVLCPGSAMPTTTGKYLQKVLDKFKPKIHYFGHHHTTIVWKHSNGVTIQKLLKNIEHPSMAGWFDILTI